MAAAAELLQEVKSMRADLKSHITKLSSELKVSWPEISDMKTARARISRPIWPRNIQRVCMTSIRQNEIEGVVAHLEHLPRSL